MKNLVLLLQKEYVTRFTRLRFFYLFFICHQNSKLGENIDEKIFPINSESVLFGANDIKYFWITTNNLHIFYIYYYLRWNQTTPAFDGEHEEKSVNIKCDDACKPGMQQFEHLYVFGTVWVHRVWYNFKHPNTPRAKR